ncbi:MAG: hypothetical protein JWL88_736 [Parcubacteria group bacterium]|nr:hypothetical protein [Parcubacteria group bacterium]
MSAASDTELKEALTVAGETGLSSTGTSALATLIIGTNSMESISTQNPDVARIISALGNRLMTLAQTMGRPLMPRGVGERADE